MISAYLLSAFTWPTPTALRTTCSPWAVNPDWFVPSPGRPLASFTHQCSGSVCDFDGSGSSDSDGTIASYAWQFGDGTSGSGPTPHHVYAIGNQYVVTLTVTDDTGTTGALNMTIDANAPPVAVLTAACSGPTCTFDASGFVGSRWHDRSSTHCRSVMGTAPAS